MKDDCELHSEPFTLKVKVRPKNEQEVAKFCATHPIANSRLSESPTWFDHIQRPGQLQRLLVQPVVAYVAALARATDATGCHDHSCVVPNGNK